MFHPVPVYVGLRYVVSRSRGFFVSFISWISMAGICVGLVVLTLGWYFHGQPAFRNGR